MLPAPARIAAPPRPKSRASWNPAVPPPPVVGAAVGSGLADGLGVADGDADRLGVADGLTLALGVVTLAVPLGRIVGVAEPVPAGENVVGVAEGEDAVQAETAVSEIEQYDRVILNVQPGVSVSGSAAADTVHLLAELLENATTFSPKTTQVIVSGHKARGGGSLINVTDGGMGMPEEHLRQLNWQLAHPPLADVAVARHMGLYAVAHLAARHGIKVALGLRPAGGTTAEVHLPAALISKDTWPGGWPGQAGEVLRAGAGGAGGGAGAVAAAVDPRPSAPRFAAGPEFAVGPEIAMPDAVPLTLGAPLPSPAPAASFAVTVPEPVGTEPGGALPIFESVESDYLHTRRRGLLPPRS